MPAERALSRQLMLAHKFLVGFGKALAARLVGKG